MPTDASMRDIGDARLAFTTLSELIENYPDSPYAFDARQRLISIRNRMARAEIHVANYYFTRGAYMAAANRGKYVVENFQQTPAVPDGTFNFDHAVANSNGGILDRLSLGLIQRENPPKFDSREIFDKPTIEGKKQKRSEKNETSSILNRITFGIFK